jgi:hypothetical protein
MSSALNKIAPSLRLDAVASLVDNSGGTASGTIAVIADGATANAIASLNAKLDALKTQLELKGYQNT